MGRDIAYTPPSALLDAKRYEDFRHGFENDVVSTATERDLVALMTSPHWEDRVRAGVLLSRIEPVLPDAFPVIVEIAGSPNHNRNGHNPNARDHVWVKHPKIGVLAEVLEEYQAVWDAYTDQWGPQSRRVFAVRMMDGVDVSGVFRPEARPQDILGRTFLTHSDILSRQPQEVKDRHAAWLDEARKVVRS